jgi:hypothetical protein
MEVKSKLSSSARRTFEHIPPATGEAARPSSNRNASPFATQALKGSSSSVFDGSTHKPPRIDHFGYNKETHKGRELLNRNAKNILAEAQHIPAWWTSKNIRDTKFQSTHLDLSGTKPEPTAALSTRAPTHVRHLSQDQALSGLPEKYTRTRMLETRKKEVIPDGSYDLDGDGFVGGRDYVVARRFDEGFKNYLTPAERTQAIEAVKNVSSIFSYNNHRFLHRAMKKNSSGTSRPLALKDSTEFCRSVESWWMRMTTELSLALIQTIPLVKSSQT